MLCKGISHSPATPEGASRRKTTCVAQARGVESESLPSSFFTVIACGDRYLWLYSASVNAPVYSRLSLCIFFGNLPIFADLCQICTSSTSYVERNIGKVCLL